MPAHVEAFRHRCGARTSNPVCGREVAGRFDSYTLPPLLLVSNLLSRLQSTVSLSCGFLADACPGTPAAGPSQ